MNEQQKQKTQKTLEQMLIKARIGGGIAALETMAQAFKKIGDDVTSQKVLDWAEVYRYMLAKANETSKECLKNLETPPTINE